MAMRFHTFAGPREGEYTIQVNDVPVSDEEEAAQADLISDSVDGEVTIKDAKLELFPITAPPGSVNLVANAIRGTLSLSALSAALGPEPSKSETQQQNMLDAAPTRRSTKNDKKGKNADQLIAKSRNIVGRLW